MQYVEYPDSLAPAAKYLVAVSTSRNPVARRATFCTTKLPRKGIPSSAESALRLGFRFLVCGLARDHFLEGPRDASYVHVSIRAETSPTVMMSSWPMERMLDPDDWLELELRLQMLAVRRPQVREMLASGWSTEEVLLGSSMCILPLPDVAPRIDTT
jgi:hypothetical protein